MVVYTTLDYSTSQSQVTRICAVAQKPKTTKVGRNWGVPGTLTTLWLRQPRLFVWRVNKYVPRTSVGVSICPRSCSTVTVAHPTPCELADLMRCATLSLIRVSSSTYDAGRTARQRMKESPKKNQPFHFTVPPTAPFTLQLPFTAADLRWTSAQVWKA